MLLPLVFLPPIPSMYFSYASPFMDFNKHKTWFSTFANIRRWYGSQQLVVLFLIYLFGLTPYLFNFFSKCDTFLSVLVYVSNLILSSNSSHH